jgi:hypothetical protein
MPVETPSLFAQVIKDHLALKERNATLDRHMPIDGYRAADPFENHPLFKTEEQARHEETMDGVKPHFATAGTEPEYPGREETVENTTAAVEDTGFWAVDRARDFDWGD